MRNIGLLTGTFDPVHLGHVELAKAAMRECGLDEVWLMVNAQPGHKSGATAYEHRLAMAELAVGREASINVYRGDLAGSPHVMPTFLELMSRHLPDEFVFVVGMDVMSRLNGWEDAQSIVENATFAVAHRHGSPVKAVDGLRTNLFEFDGYAGASSSSIRGRLAAGELSDELDSRVHEYIRDNGLYRSPSHSA
jgi:nicotinate-nucleotide adenylyltransferase